MIKKYIYTLKLYKHYIIKYKKYNNYSNILFIIIFRFPK